jgi:hypothetical protein
MLTILSMALSYVAGAVTGILVYRNNIARAQDIESKAKKAVGELQK